MMTTIHPNSPVFPILSTSHSDSAEQDFLPSSSRSRKTVIQHSDAFRELTEDQAKKILSYRSGDAAGYIVIPGEKEFEYLLLYKKPFPLDPLILHASEHEVSFKAPGKTLTAKTLKDLLELLKKENILPENLKMISIPKSVAKVAKIIKDIYVRKIILTHQLSPLIERLTHFKADQAGSSQVFPGLEKKKLEPLTLLFCKIINEMKNNRAYNGKTVRIDSTKKNKKFHVWVRKDKKKRLFIPPYNFRVEKSLDGHQIRILVIPPSPNALRKKYFLDQGTYKKVFALHELTLSTPSLYKQKVLIRTRKPSEGCTYAVLNERICSGLKAQKELHAQLSAPGLNKINIPQRLIEYEESASDGASSSQILAPQASDSNLNKALEATQDWYNGSLDEAIKKGTLVLDFNSPSKKALELLDYLTVFLDVAYFLSNMHAEGFVHRDVKPLNILIKIVQKKGEKATKDKDLVQGFLTDFDFLQKVGDQSGSNNSYPYWDSLSREFEFATPFIDCYGFAISLLAFLLARLKLPFDTLITGVLYYPVLKNYVERLELAKSSAPPPL